MVVKYVGAHKKKQLMKRSVYSSGGSSWVLDSGCTNHMTGERDMFTSLNVTNESQEIVFGDSARGNYNLLSVSQLCEKGFNCLFTDEGVQILRREDSSIAFTGRLKGKLYLVDFTTTRLTPKTCLVATSDKGWLWHRRLAHVGMKNLAKLQKDEHILGLTNVSFEKDKVCSASQARKQVGVPHPAKNIISISRPLELLHMVLFGSVVYISIGGNKYGLVIVDDYSRFTWVFFLSDKSETQEVLKKSEDQKGRSDNGKDFKNTGVEEYLDEEGIKHEFSVPYTPQQNGVVERKTGHSLRQLGPCLMSTRHRTTFGLKLLTPRAMQSTVSIFTRSTRRHYTSYWCGGKEKPDTH
ncbi:hypothetical protein U9M48_003340 [Paspalum notatum var. saurae]|uniref:Integrase catalytic domain-containing protein n=1 Tax=Paspalum notatum var. saurae TaxID=547442 RepID=A0AAQ3PT69_PASNO